MPWWRLLQACAFVCIFADFARVARKRLNVSWLLAATIGAWATLLAAAAARVLDGH